MHPFGIHELSSVLLHELSSLQIQCGSIGSSSPMRQGSFAPPVLLDPCGAPPAFLAPGLGLAPWSLVGLAPGPVLRCVPMYLSTCNEGSQKAVNVI